MGCTHLWVTGNSLAGEVPDQLLDRLEVESRGPRAIDTLGAPVFVNVRTGRAFAEPLIDCEEDRALRVVMGGILREHDRRR